MAEFVVTDPDTGRKVRMTGESAPTEAEIQQAFASLPQERSLLGRAGRELGLTGRAALEGANDVVAPFTNAVSWMLNKGLSVTPTDFRFPEQSQNFSQLLTRAGIPEPETVNEQRGNFGGRVMTGFFAGQPLTKAASARLGVTPPTSQFTTAKTPTVEQLKTASSNAYQAADNAGVAIAKRSFTNFADDLSKELAEEGIDRTLHPNMTAALKRLSDDKLGDVTFKQADTLRKIVRGAAASINPDERRLAQIATERLDDFMSGLKSTDVISGDPALASSLLRTARDFWMRGKKATILDEMVEKARNSAPNFSGSGTENALRTQFRQLANNPKRMRAFTMAEQEAIKKVARGGPIENSLRQLGKFAPTGVVSGTLSGGAGAIIGQGLGLGSGVGAVALPTLGFGARQGATALTKQNIEAVSRLVRQGVSPAQIPEFTTLPPAIQQLIMGTPTGAGVLADRSTQ